MSRRSVFIKWYVVFHISIQFQTVRSATISNQNASGWFTNELYPDEIVNGEEKRDTKLLLNEFFQARTNLLNDELNSSFGSNITLSEKELIANQKIMAEKYNELKIGFFNPHSFNPARHIFDVLSDIKQSKLFHIIKKMPKGGMLHIHDAAMCSANYLVSLTYWPNLWQRTSNGSQIIKEFRFSRKQPNDSNIQIQSNAINSNVSDSNYSVWSCVKDVRAKMGASIYDAHVRSMFTLYDSNINPTTQYRDINDVWKRFVDIFAVVGGLITFMPARKAFYKRAFQEMYDDGVQYVEFKTSLKKAYDLDGNFYTSEETVQSYLDVLKEFKREHPLFIGSKLIYAKQKSDSNEVITSHFQTIRELHAKFPQTFVGFDLVGQEDKAPSLQTLAENIFQLPNDVQLFLHAGETNWFGSVDENLIDAVLLGSRRIGHGYALVKHPKVIDLVKRNDIAVEVNPISNQVLKLVSDIRNHPASILFAQNVPIVISSDDPSYWEVSSLSHDFYVTFLGIVSYHSDLRTLKQLAINSIRYSSLKGFDKLEALMKWQIKWDAFIDDLIRYRD